MSQRNLTFVIPTYRLRDVGKTVEDYDEHFWRNGHAVRLMVFDDSSRANQEKYYALLEQTRTHNELFYVGPREKEEFLAYVNGRLRDARLEGLVKNLFQPSYGGNRNCTLMYTLGGLVVSADDDMRPYALMEDSPESLDADEVSRGRLHRVGTNHCVHKSFDILAAFRDVLGKPVRELPENYERGELIVDSSMDLETNASMGLSLENTLMLRDGAVSDDAIVKVAQTFRSGTNDIDASDDQADPDAINNLYVLVNFRPVVTNQNWRMDCGVAGYDNTFGLPRSSRPGSASRTTFTGCGYGGQASCRRTSTRHSTTRATTTCATRQPPRSSTRRSRTSSSGGSRRPSPGSASSASSSTTTAR